MKQVTVILLLVLTLISAPDLHAQSATPGYLGKRVMVEYSLATWAPIYFSLPVSGTLTNFNGAKIGWPDSGFFLRMRHMIGGSVCLSRRSVLGGHLSWQRAGYYSQYFSFSNNFEFTFGQITAPGIGVQFRSFYFLRRGNIAPVGPYSEVQYSLMLPILRTSERTLKPVVARKLYSSLGLQSGYTAAITNRILFSFGIEIQLPVFNKVLHPLTASRRDIGDALVLYDAMQRLNAFNVRLSLQGLLF
jgi:hypothetical protein